MELDDILNNDKLSQLEIEIVKSGAGLTVGTVLKVYKAKGQLLSTNGNVTLRHKNTIKALHGNYAIIKRIRLYA